MAKYEIGRPRQDVRLRNWSKGRLASLKLMLSRLEESLDAIGPAANLQSSARAFDDKVPFILDLSVDAGYKQFVVNFSEPPGLASNHPNRQLLFYELQYSETNFFSNPTTIENPQRQFLIGGIGRRATRYFRVRTINTRFEASRWSSIVAATTASATIEQTDIADVSLRLIEDIGVWQDVFTKVYDPFGGAVCLNVQLALGAVQEDVTVSNVKTSRIVKTFNSGPAFVQFRFVQVVNNVNREFGQRTILSARTGYTGRRQGKTPMAFGTFMSDFFRPGNDEITIKLQAAKIPGSEWRGGEKAPPAAFKTSDPLCFVRNAKLIEALEVF